MLLASMTAAELKEVLAGWGEPAYRAGQLFTAFSRGEKPEEMTNLSKPLREKVAQAGVGTVSILQTWTSADGTRKHLFRLHDGNLVEGVVMKYHYGYTLCVSTQVGCAMGCAFCASTLEGKVRDLEAGEILGQVAAANRELGGGLGDKRKITNVVMMGSGEPLDNYDNSVRFLKLVGDPKGLGISPRNISLSTCGLVERMDRFTGEGIPVTLSISLHAPNDEIRRSLMPVAKKWTIEQVLGAADRYAAATGRRYIVEYALTAGANDSLACAGQLALRLKGRLCHVNLIGLNAVAETGLKGPARRHVEAFQQELTRLGVSATIRREMGSDIQGACGQLRRRVLEGGDVTCGLQH